MKYNIDERIERLRQFSLDLIGEDFNRYDIWIKELSVINKINEYEEKWKKVESNVFSLNKSTLMNEFFEKNKNKIKIKVIKHPIKGRLTRGSLGTLGGAGIGASIGTMIAPGIGTGIGALAGSALGIGLGGASGSSSDAKKIISEELRPLRKSDIRILPTGSPQPPMYDELIKRKSNKNSNKTNS